MLLAVEGGGLFSSSSLGYSKGLTLLLLGKKGEEKPMRVTPWNQYQLVDQESYPDCHLASNKNRFTRGCTSFLCFGRAAAGLESPSPLKVGPTQHHHLHEDVIKTSPHSEKNDEKTPSSNVVDHDNNIYNPNASSLRSSLKKPTTTTTTVSVSIKNEGEETNGVDHIERRVQWTDVSGGDLFMIREFEPSEHSGSDDEYGNGNERSCSCRLM